MRLNRDSSFPSPNANMNHTVVSCTEDKEQRKINHTKHIKWVTSTKKFIKTHLKAIEKCLNYTITSPQAQIGD